MRLHVKIIPNAKRSEVVSFENNILKIKITSPPVDGKANQALISFLSEKFDLPCSAIQIIRGKTSRTKILEIEARNMNLEKSVLKQR